MESIISACITGLLALMGIVISNVASNKSMEIKVSSNMELTNEKIDQLRHSVDKHNDIVERVPVLEGRVDMIEKRVDGVEIRLNSYTAPKQNNNV